MLLIAVNPLPRQSLREETTYLAEPLRLLLLEEFVLLQSTYSDFEYARLNVAQYLNLGKFL